MYTLSCSYNFGHFQKFFLASSSYICNVSKVGKSFSEVWEEGRPFMLLYWDSMLLHWGRFKLKFNKNMSHFGAFFIIISQTMSAVKFLFELCWNSFLNFAVVENKEKLHLSSDLQIMIYWWIIGLESTDMFHLVQNMSLFIGSSFSKKSKNYC